MSDEKKLKEEIASLSGFRARFVLNLMAEGRTLIEAIQMAKEFFKFPKPGPSEIKEA